MTRELSARILVGLSILYGATIGVLAALDVEFVAFAIVGAAALGALWVVRGVVGDRRRT